MRFSSVLADTVIPLASPKTPASAVHIKTSSSSKKMQEEQVVGKGFKRKHKHSSRVEDDEQDTDEQSVDAEEQLEKEVGMICFA